MSGTSLALIFVTVSNTLGLPEGLLSAVCWVESSHRPMAINLEDGVGPSLGICQIKFATARLMGFMGTPTQLMNPKVNAHYAGKYLAWQMDRYDYDVTKAVAAYNSGTHLVNSKGQTKNQSYVNKVMEAWDEER